MAPYQVCSLKPLKLQVPLTPLLLSNGLVIGQNCQSLISLVLGCCKRWAATLTRPRSKPGLVNASMFKQGFGYSLRIVHSIFPHAFHIAGPSFVADRVQLHPAGCPLLGSRLRITSPRDPVAGGSDPARTVGPP